MVKSHGGGVKLLNNQQVANIEWKMLNLEKLFGKSTRGRRFLKVQTVLVVIYHL